VPSRWQPGQWCVAHAESEAHGLAMMRQVACAGDSWRMTMHCCACLAGGKRGWAWKAGNVTILRGGVGGGETGRRMHETSFLPPAPIPLPSLVLGNPGLLPILVCFAAFVAFAASASPAAGAPGGRGAGSARPSGPRARSWRGAPTAGPRARRGTTSPCSRGCRGASAGTSACLPPRADGKAGWTELDGQARHQQGRGVPPHGWRGGGSQVVLVNVHAPLPRWRAARGAGGWGGLI
jgi:hypothetical protein